MYNRTMAQVEKTKLGGPYSKPIRQKRQNEVFRLYFEKGYSALKISEFLQVNRNTINEDIKYWFSEMSNEFGNKNTKNWLLKQFYRLDLQRNRLFENLDQCKEIDEKIKVERLIFDIDFRLTNLISQMVKSWGNFFSLEPKE